MAKSKFPETLYVTQDNEDGNVYELAYRTLNDLEQDATKVAVYKLEKVNTLSITKELKG